MDGTMLKDSTVVKDSAVRSVSRRSRRNRGATMVEYILIVAVIAVGILVAWKKFGGSMQSSLETMSGVVSDTTEAGATGQGWENP